MPTPSGLAPLRFAASILLPLQLAPWFAPGASAAPPSPGWASAGRHRADTWSQPRAGPFASPDELDELAALEAIRIALTEVGDGSAYVWHRRSGMLSGWVRPTTAFKDAAGRPCRHIILLIVRGDRVGGAEGTACRLGDGRWDLER